MNTIIRTKSSIRFIGVVTIGILILYTLFSQKFNLLIIDTVFIILLYPYLFGFIKVENNTISLNGSFLVKSLFNRSISINTLTQMGLGGSSIHPTLDLYTEAGRQLRVPYTFFPVSELDNVVIYIEKQKKIIWLKDSKAKWEKEKYFQKNLPFK